MDGNLEFSKIFEFKVYSAMVRIWLTFRLSSLALPLKMAVMIWSRALAKGRPRPG